MRVQPFPADRYLWVAILLAISAGFAHSQDTQIGPIAVPATAVIFDPDNVLSPEQLAALRSAGPLNPVPAVKALSFNPAAGQTIIFAASGMVGCCSVAQVGPDGYAGSAENITGIGSISGYASNNAMALVGVFTDGNPSGAAPDDYDYMPGVNQPSFSPVLNQVFFIGDGLTGTGSGTRQIFNVPPAATELWLGFVDGGGWKGPPQNYGDNPGGVQVWATFSTTDCTQLVNFDPDQVHMYRDPDLTSNAGQSNEIEQRGYLYVYTGVRVDGKVPETRYKLSSVIPSLVTGPGILVDITDAITAKPGITLPPDFIPEQVQNVIRWHGNAVYGEGPNAKTEYPAAIANGLSMPLFDPKPKTSGAYDKIYGDSPDISVPLQDQGGLPLTAVCYEKDFKTYIGCQMGNGRFHVMGNFKWQAHYCGTVKVDTVFGVEPTSAAAHFTPATTNAVTFQRPTSIDKDEQKIPFLDPKACEISFVTFNGSIPGHCTQPAAQSP